VAESAVSDAAVNPERIAQLTDQINQQKAAIAQHQAELNKWVGTTAQVDASQYAAATAIASETRRLPSWNNSCNSYWLPSRPLRTDRYPVCFLWGVRMLDPLGDTLAEPHLRRADIGVDLVSLLQKLNLGSEMKLAHALQVVWPDSWSVEMWKDGFPAPSLASAALSLS
jgi:hypothetical protein